MRTYLYCLTFPDGKRYIGVTSRLTWRVKRHKRYAKTREIAVGQAIAEYGMPPMTILCIGERHDILDLEAKAIVAFRTDLPEYGYNKRIGSTFSPEHRANLSKAMKGRPAWNKGVPRTAQERANIKAALAESENFIPDRLAGWNKGIPNSPETRAKISAKGKGQPKSPEHRAKIAASMMGNTNRHHC